jgi:hypothetical protein
MSIFYIFYNLQSGAAKVVGAELVPADTDTVRGTITRMNKATNNCTFPTFLSPHFLFTTS